MILTKQILIKWSPASKTHYENLGYKFTKWGDEFVVPVFHLPQNSHKKVGVKCDLCGEEKETQYRYYLSNIRLNNDDKYLCLKCMANREEMLKEKTKKAQATNLQRYGVKSPGELKEVQEKMKQTCLEKYGSEYYFSSSKGKEEVKKGMLKKYGVEHPLEKEEFLEKSKQTCQSHYGVDFSLSSEEVRQKGVKTSLQRYGVDIPSKSTEVQQKIRNTTFLHFGVYWALASSEVREKGIRTNIQRYGVENPAQSPEIQAKIRKTFFKTGKTRTSKQQLEVFNILKDNYEQVSLNYPLRKYSLDCFLVVNSIKIDVEYDGWYWHQFLKEEDNARDLFVNENGIRIIRIRGGVTTPSKTEMLDLIDKIIKEDLWFIEKIYPEWERNINKGEKDC